MPPLFFPAQFVTDEGDICADFTGFKTWNLGSGSLLPVTERFYATYRKYMATHHTGRAIYLDTAARPEVGATLMQLGK